MLIYIVYKFNIILKNFIINQCVVKQTKVCNDKSQSSDLSTPIAEEQLEKERSKAMEYKQKGNRFVQLKEWGKAIAAYNKAIEIFPYDATFYANRALCYLKQNK